MKYEGIVVNVGHIIQNIVPTIITLSNAEYANYKVKRVFAGRMRKAGTGNYHIIRDDLSETLQTNRLSKEDACGIVMLSSSTS